MTTARIAYMLGLDLGKKRDWTALAVLKQSSGPIDPENRYDLIHLDRWQGKDYRDAIPRVEQVVELVRQVAMQEFLKAHGYNRPGEGEPVISLVVDQTGVGEAVVESLRDAGLRCQGIIIHGGDAVSRMDGGYRVPKRELVGTVEVLLENRRIRFPRKLNVKSNAGKDMAEILVQELQTFKAKINLTTGHTSFAADEAWRENPHDDTVLAVALAAWYGEHVNPAASAATYEALRDYYNSQFA